MLKEERKRLEQKEMDKTESFKDFVLRRGDEIFGNDVYVRNYVVRRGEEGFISNEILSENENCCAMIVRPLESMPHLESEIKLSYKNNQECIMICHGGGYMRINTVERLMEKGKCHIGIRSNRLGLYPVTQTDSESWLRIYDFHTKDKECAEIFLKELHEYSLLKKEDTEEEFEEPEEKGFCAQVWREINKVFNQNLDVTFPTEFYPSVDPEKLYCYELFRIYLDEDFL